jgi:hypothetical protein
VRLLKSLVCAPGRAAIVFTLPCIYWLDGQKDWVEVWFG